MQRSRPHFIAMFGLAAFGLALSIVIRANGASISAATTITLSHLVALFFGVRWARNMGVPQLRWNLRTLFGWTAIIAIMCSLFRICLASVPYDNLNVSGWVAIALIAGSTLWSLVVLLNAANQIVDWCLARQGVNAQDKSRLQ